MLKMKIQSILSFLMLIKLSLVIFLCTCSVKVFGQIDHKGDMPLEHMVYCQQNTHIRILLFLDKENKIAVTREHIVALNKENLPTDTVSIHSLAEGTQVVNPGVQLAYAVTKERFIVYGIIFSALLKLEGGKIKTTHRYAPEAMGEKPDFLIPLPDGRIFGPDVKGKEKKYTYPYVLYDKDVTPESRRVVINRLKMLGENQTYGHIYGTYSFGGDSLFVNPPWSGKLVVFNLKNSKTTIVPLTEKESLKKESFTYFYDHIADHHYVVQAKGKKEFTLFHLSKDFKTLKKVKAIPYFPTAIVAGQLHIARQNKVETCHYLEPIF
jgi:hypothetical protein